MIVTRALLLTCAIGAVVSVSSCSISHRLAQRDPNNVPITREFAWDGAETLIVGVAAEVRFVQGPGPGTVVVTGRPRSVQTFSAAGGVLEDATFRTGAPLKVVVTAPKITRFVVKGRDKLVIENFEQDELRIETTGWADVKAAGRAGVVHLSLLGSGWVDLSQVEARGAEVTLTGFRRAIVAPRDWAKISGNGDVILTSEPTRLAQDSHSSGRVIRVRVPAPIGTAM